MAHQPHVVMMDIVMPDVDGIKATQAITTYNPQAKVVVILAKENKETMNEVIKHGGSVLS